MTITAGAPQTVGWKLGQHVEGAANLERAHWLQIFRLQKQRLPLVVRVRDFKNGREQRRTSHSLSRGSNLVERNQF
jgi:hypothetical protein